MVGSGVASRLVTAVTLAAVDSASATPLYTVASPAMVPAVTPPHSDDGSLPTAYWLFGMSLRSTETSPPASSSSR